MDEGSRLYKEGDASIETGGSPKTRHIKLVDNQERLILWPVSSNG